MQQHQLLILSLELTKLLFVFSLGACIGSLTNVLVYRMPRGLNVVTPSSRCPKCQTKLRWNDNIPILGWLALRGRCRYCNARISPEYPIVELIGALLFAIPFFLFYTILEFPAMDLSTTWLGVDWALLAPEWTRHPTGLMYSWPIFLSVLVLLACLLPATIIDARTFMIPLVLTWIPAIAAIAILPATAAWHESIHATTSRRFLFADGWSWAIASPGPTGWKWVGGSIGATIGLGASLLLVKLNLLKRSFADYDEWEENALAKAQGDKSPPRASTTPEQDPSPSASPDSDQAADEAPKPDATDEPEKDAPPTTPHAIVTTAIVLLCAVAGGLIANALAIIPFLGVAAGILLAPILAGAIHRLRTPSQTEEQDSDDSPADMWLQYPHARRESFRELSFLGVPALLALAGWIIAPRLAAPWHTDPTTFQQIPAQLVPLWLDVLAGVLIGYLVGGGVVWAIRILGSLAFGKEAMGMGDVHLMAGVGACLGWIDPTLAFFLAAFVALYLTLVAVVWAGQGRRAMPFGPALVVATILIFLGKAGVEWGINKWLGRTPQDQNMIDLP